MRAESREQRAESRRMEVRVRRCCCSLETTVVIVGIIQVGLGDTHTTHTVSPGGKLMLGYPRCPN